MSTNEYGRFDGLVLFPTRQPARRAPGQAYYLCQPHLTNQRARTLHLHISTRFRPGCHHPNLLFIALVASRPNSMPLHLAQHKSYHPYRRENIDRVKKDEEVAYKADVDEKERVAARNRHDRIIQLRRQRDGATGRQDPINTLSDYEHIDRYFEAETLLKPSQYSSGSSIKLELQPWYTQADRKNGLDQKKSEHENERAKLRDEERKRREDPLELIREYTQRPSTPPVRDAKQVEPTASHAKQRSFFRKGTRAKRDARVRCPERHF